MAKVILKTLSTQEDRDIAALNDAGRPRLATQQWYSDGVVFCFRLYGKSNPALPHRCITGLAAAFCMEQTFVPMLQLAGANPPIFWLFPSRLVV